MKDSFILYLEQQSIFEMLTDEQAGKLIKNIYQYERSGNIPQMDQILTLAFIPIMQVLDKNRIKYEKVVERNKNNIEKRWQKEDTKNTTGKFGKKENTKNTDNVNDNENVNDNDNNNNVVVSDSCVDGLQKIFEFYEKNIGLITPYGAEVLEDYAKEMEAEVIIYAMKISVEADKRNIKYIKAILNNWSKKGIKTIIEAKKESKNNVKNKLENQRDYTGFDFNKLYANGE